MNHRVRARTRTTQPRRGEPQLDALDLTAFAALSFDCYGTLIDWERGIETALRPWLARHGGAPEGVSLLGLFAESESRRQREAPQAPYREILAGCFEDIAARLDVPVDGADARAFAESIADWPPFADSAGALATLKHHFKLVIVSNVDRDSFRRSNQRLGVRFDRVVTAEDVGAYKPDLAHFRRALDELASMGIAPGAVLHIAQSLYHDHVPAKRLGLKTVWIDRRADAAGWGATPAPDCDVVPDLTVADLAAFVTLHREQLAAAGTAT